MKKKINLIDYNIEIDVEKLPKILKNIIQELEQYEKENDWVMYDGVSEGLEAGAKQCLIDRTISKNQFNLLLKKYRGYVINDV